jgi:hypothetical protein
VTAIEENKTKAGCILIHVAVHAQAVQDIQRKQQKEADRTG